jgi:enediyne biosynthesis protein E4
MLRLTGAAGRRSPARELHAGSGYWSQDSAVAVLCADFGPQQVEVRWPGGQVTTTPIPSNAREITIDEKGGVIKMR